MLKSIRRWFKKVADLPPEMEEMLGCHPDIHDERDLRKVVSAKDDPPGAYRLPSIAPAVVINQGRAGSCAGCAAAHAVLLLTSKLGIPSARFLPAYLYVYYKARELQGTVKQDSGSQLRNIMKVLKAGVPELRYHDWGANWRIPPSKDAEQAAVFKIAGYERVVRDKDDADVGVTLKKILYDEGLPIICGSRIYERAMHTAGRTGVMPIPDWEHDRDLGGHAMLITGYRKSKYGTEFQLLNSWGIQWGERGYFWVPELYLTAHVFTFDLWTFSRQYW